MYPRYGYRRIHIFPLRVELRPVEDQAEYGQKQKGTPQ
jgi:hypothetical protein